MPEHILNLVVQYLTNIVCFYVLSVAVGDGGGGAGGRGRQLAKFFIEDTSVSSIFGTLFRESVVLHVPSLFYYKNPLSKTQFSSYVSGNPSLPV
jgi:hypothetical protein